MPTFSVSVNGIFTYYVHLACYKLYENEKQTTFIKKYKLKISELLVRK